jgi:hypothetical protein
MQIKNKTTSILASAVLSLIFVVSSFSSVDAATLKGEFVFKKKAPKAAIIWFEEDTSLKSEAVIDQKNTQFTHLLAVGPKGSNVIFKNSDSINHNIYANDKESKITFDIGLAAPGSTLKQPITWEEGKLVKISCKIHPKMIAWIGSISSNHFRVVQFKKKQKKATFEITGVPDNFTKVKVLMPLYNVIEAAPAPGTPVSFDLFKKQKKKSKASGRITLTRS